MAQEFESAYTSTLSAKLAAADTSMSLAICPTVTAWRIHIVSDEQEEFISFTWNSAPWTAWNLTWLTRWLSKTAIPATAGSGLTWQAGQKVELVQMHDQMFNVQVSQTLSNPISFSWTTNSWIRISNLTTSQRTALTWANWMIVYDTTLWEHYQYIWGAWSAISAWSTQPNASITVAWKVEIATAAQSISWTDTWETWASLSILPSDIANNTQSWTFISWTASWTNTYSLALTPALTAYAKWIYIVTFTNASTWASTLNINTLWAKAIQDLWWNAIATGNILIWWTYTLYYDWTQFKIIWNIAKATTAECETATDDIKYTTPLWVSNEIWASIWTAVAKALDWTVYQATSNWLVVAYCANSWWATSVTLYSDASNPPTIVVATTWGPSGTWPCICCPVLAWKYYKITTWTVTSSYAVFYPLWV